MTRPIRSLARRLAPFALGLCAILSAAAPATAAPTAGAYLVFDARTGEVIARHNADQAWYPASVTKLMTTWVTLQAIRAGRITPNSPVVMTVRASKEPPSKMGFAPGQFVTVDNALKIIMVKSANDVAWALGEAVGGSKEAFVDEMNRQARMLGMNSSHWGNPNGLPDPTQSTTARDLGILARALLREFPEADSLWHLPGIQFRNDVIRNHNQLIDRYPGADGMKTGFICSAGFNVVATATRGNRRIVAVVLGSRSARARTELAAELFTNGFEKTGEGGLFGRFSTPETIDQMARGPEAGNPVRDVKQEICGKKKGAPDIEDMGEDSTPYSTAGTRDNGAVIRPGTPGAQPARRVSYLGQRFDPGPPVRVWLGGPEAAPPDGSPILALASDPHATPTAPIFAPAPLPPAAPDATARPPAPGAVGGRFGLYGDQSGPASQPATGPGSGAGVDASLAPADGAPMMLHTGAAAPVAAAAILGSMKATQPRDKASAKSQATTPKAVWKPGPPAAAAHAAAPAKPAVGAKPPVKKKPVATAKPIHTAAPIAKKPAAGDD